MTEQQPGWELQLDRASPLVDAMNRIALALVAIEQLGGLDDGGHHKQYALDQAARALTGKQYQEWITFVQSGNEGPHTYTWEEGTAP